MFKSQTTPAYRLHRQSGQAIVTLPQPDGRRKDHLLGPHGSEESRKEYDRLIAEWKKGAEEARNAAKAKERVDLTINEVMVKFKKHVESYYRHPDGTPTSEQENFKASLRLLKELYGHTLAAQFGPLALKDVRQKMIDANLARTQINKRIGRIKRMMKWAVAEELIPSSAYHGLLAVEGLKAGRSGAKERPRVLPVPQEHVEAVLPHLSRHVAGMVSAQRLMGCRPTEICSVRRCDIDMSGTIWFYRPARHKTAWHGKDRIIAVGPKAQAILKEFFTPNIDDFLFSPRRQMEERAANLRARRKTKVQPSQQYRKKKTPKKQPGERYGRLSYAAAIHAACKKTGTPIWAPNRLRHSFATDIRKRFGLEAAQVGLGHSKADVTQIYAERDSQLAAQIAAQVG